MANYIHFRGLKHYPTGNASLRLENKELLVSGLTQSWDGLSIETKGDWELSLQPLTITKETIIGATFNAVDGLKRVTTLAQWAITQNPNGKYAYLLLNGKMEGSDITLTGTKAGREVFTKCYIQPNTTESNWFIVAIFTLTAAPVLLSDMDYRTEIKRDTGNKITSTTITKSFGSSGIVSPGMTAFKGKNIRAKISDESYHVDRFYISSSFHYPEGLPEEKERKMTQVILTGQSSEPLVLMDKSHEN